MLCLEIMAESIELVVFDMYGTLVQIGDNRRPYHKLLRDLNLTKDEIRLASMFALTESFSSFSEYVRKVRTGISGIKCYEDDIAAEVASVNLFPDAISTLEGLRDKGIAVGLISNLASPYVKPFFDLGLDKYVDFPLFSCNVGLRKPDERIYERMLSHFGIEPHKALMIGDNPNSDVVVPKSLGMNSVLLDRAGKSNFSPKVSSLAGIFCLSLSV
jgi:HAD superfamily hydrolase (TIGR01509 family)